VTAPPLSVQALQPRRGAEVAVCLDGVSKAYKLYDRPFNYFKEALTGRAYHRNKVVLSDVSFTLKRGEILGIIGRNGAGKSTLLKLIAGTLAPTQGNIAVHGRVAAILELGTGFNPNYSGRDNVILSALMRGMSEDAVRRKFDSIIAFAGLEGVIDEPFHTYSSGMQARLAFAAATAVEADVLVIDEALAAGDIRFASRSLRRIHEICQSGVTALFVSHMTYHVMQLCSRAIWVDDGRIRMDGPPLEVVRAYEYEMHEAIARDDGRIIPLRTLNAVSSVVSPTTDTLASTDALALRVAAAPFDASVPIDSMSPTDESVSTTDASGAVVVGFEEHTTKVLRIDSVSASNCSQYMETGVGRVSANASGALALDDEKHSTQVAGMEAAEVLKEEAIAGMSVGVSASISDERDASKSGARIQHFSTGQYQIDEILFLDKDGRCTNTFRFGELMQLKVTYKCLMPELPQYSCGLAVAFNRVSDFESVMYFNSNYPHSDEELQTYFNVPFRTYLGRTGQLEAIIDLLQLRAGEYYVSLGILPNHPGPHEFYEYIRCHLRIIVLANGFDEPSVFYPIVRWTNGPIVS
jgi:ABC-type polysaccharide/polyol phosphate transport system ATPase subunit